MKGLEGQKEWRVGWGTTYFGQESSQQTGRRDDFLGKGGGTSSQEPDHILSLVGGSRGDPSTQPAHLLSIRGRCCGLFKEEGAEAARSCLPPFPKALISWLHGGKAEPKERPLRLRCLQGGEDRWEPLGPRSGPQVWPWQELPRAPCSMGAGNWSSPAWHLLVGILDSYRVRPIGGRGVVNGVGAIAIVTHLHGLCHTWAREAKSAEPRVPCPHLPPPCPRHPIPVGPSTATCRGARPAWLQSTVKVWGTRALTPAPSPGPEHFTFPGSTTSFTGTRNGLPVRRRPSAPPACGEGLFHRGARRRPALPLKRPGGQSNLCKHFRTG